VLHFVATKGDLGESILIRFLFMFIHNTVKSLDHLKSLVSKYRADCDDVIPPELVQLNRQNFFDDELDG
jgi:hypothetical protein